MPGAPSRDALRGVLRDDAKRALDCALPALGDGHTHKAHATRMRVHASGLRYRALTAWMSLSVRRSALKLEIEAKAQIWTEFELLHKSSGI